MTGMDWAEKEAKYLVTPDGCYITVMSDGMPFESYRGWEEVAEHLRAAELRGRVKGMFDAAQIARGSHTAVGYDIFAAIHTAATKLESPPTT